MSDGAESAAEVLDRKAAYARRRAVSFRQGAAGEEATASALAGLTLHGWFVLHDRAVPSGGNIDHLLIGPGGVVVVDSKNWAGEVVVTREELRVGGRNRSAQVAAVTTLAAVVEKALQGGGHQAPVFSVVALTQKPPPNGPVRLAAGPLVAGVHDLAVAVGLLPQVVRPVQVDALVAAVLAAFPAGDRSVEEVREAADHKPAGELFLRGNIFLFVEPWARSGHRRLYLKDVDGENAWLQGSGVR